MKESELRKQIQIEASNRGHRLFRNQVGFGWYGVVRHVGDEVRITRARPVHAGLFVGAPDLIGWTRAGRFLAIEIKIGKTAITQAQKRFLDEILRAGGNAGVARSVEDAVKIMDDTA